MSELERDFINSNLARLIVGINNAAKPERSRSPRETMQAANDILAGAQSLGSRVLCNLNETKDTLIRIAEALEGIRIEAEAARRGQ